MATYAEMFLVYNDEATMQRAQMCITEQAHIFVNDTRNDIKRLAQGVISGLWNDIDAIYRACVTGPSGATLGEDAALLGAVQSVWPTVAAARYGLYPTDAMLGPSPEQAPKYRGPTVGSVE